MAAVTMGRPALDGARALTCVTALLVWVAAAIHLVLTPEHFEERTAYGVFFLVAVAFQLVIGWLLFRGPTSATLRAGAAGSLLLLVVWMVTRVVTPPLAPEAGAEPVTLLGVVATATELAALVLLVGAAPLPMARSRRHAVGWGAVAATAFAGLLLLATNAVSYTSFAYLANPGRPPALSVYTDGLSLQTPLIYGQLLPHVWLVASWSTLLFVAVAAVMLGVNVALLMRHRACLTGDARRTVGSALPAFVAVSGCCGAPLALFLGTSAVVALARLTPWLLLATIGLLSVNVAVVRRAVCQADGSSPDRRAHSLKAGVQ